ncbi:DUF2889 domain-containing protein [Mycolicibacterium arenosum]|uniref:DUF2889 domain-containing protein n=1 Tax=Mycolicibacterium arenosum TaxID=2952157 RepID=A0ABT1MDA3_9MYCO|nr:DUF2889 domain-containing protein [Mycolicibacterium sp. CAU 1645]MCP9276845.1 DUF2889 domain-containing protein [Mycolicibacterium sp. CAU 1645]
MPFVSDIVGPQRPVQRWPMPAPGTMRRTSSIDTQPDGPVHQDTDLRARDVHIGPAGSVEVVDDVVVRARLADRVIDDIAGADARLAELRGVRVGQGFRAKAGALLGSDVDRATLLNLLLDDWVGASLVTGYGVQHANIVAGEEEEMADVVADHLAGICSGFAPDAAAVDFTRRTLLMPCAQGPAAPRLDGLHPTEVLRAHGMRRLRRIDLTPDGAFDAHFRDSHVDGDGRETIVHEYTVVGEVDGDTRTVARIDVEARVLPWRECPGALGSASRVVGMPVGQLRNRIRTEFVGITTCTHLNDTLRCLGDIDALMDGREARSSVLSP